MRRRGWYSLSMRLYSIEGNTQKLDGGAMFGNCPRALWSRWCPPDELNRIPLACRAMLVIEDSGRVVLFEAGIGAFFSSPLRQSAARTLPWGCDGETAGKDEYNEEVGNVEKDRSCAGKRTREKEVAEAQAANVSWSHADSSRDSGGGNSGVRDSLQEEWQGQSAESRACSKARAEAHSGDE